MRQILTGLFEKKKKKDEKQRGGAGKGERKILESNDRLYWNRKNQSINKTVRTRHLPRFTN